MCAYQFTIPIYDPTHSTHTLLLLQSEFYFLAGSWVGEDGSTDAKTTEKSGLITRVRLQFLIWQFWTLIFRSFELIGLLQPN